MGKRQLTKQKLADRVLCPVAVSCTLGLKVCDVADAMRRAGVTQALTAGQAKAWRTMREQPPDWLAALLADAAARQAKKAAREKERDLEHEHRMLLLGEEVERRLLAGATHFGGPAELIATDIAFRAMKELVRCDGDVSWLLPLDLAALRWAGVDPADCGTWFLCRPKAPGEHNLTAGADGEPERFPACEKGGVADPCGMPLAPDGHCPACDATAADLTEQAMAIGGAELRERARSAIARELDDELGPDAVG
jgi:hypothetical protein